MGWTIRILSRLADWLTSDARAEHQDTQPPQLDGFVFRSRQGDVRDTAAAMIPDMDEQGEPK